MSVRNLTSLFRPKSIAVIGATTRANAVGAIVTRNLLQGGFGGPIMPVNRNHGAIAGVLAYPDVEHLPVDPDLGVLCIPAAGVTQQLEKLGNRGCRAAIVFASGFDTAGRDDLVATARRHDMRLLGPTTLGVMAPGVGLNASFMTAPALPGRIAFVSQSASLASAVLDWARPQGIGFSHFISLGEAADVEFGDILDFLGSDPGTRAILLYIESIRQRRNFMSAARAAARNKLVLAIKAGRSREAASATASHTGSLAGSDAIYEAAFGRAGMLRVFELEEMFTAAETLARLRPPRGSALAILSNGGGIAVMAVDELADRQGHLAVLAPDTVARLDKVLPDGWSRANPADIRCDATPERYARVLDILIEAPEVDATLVMLAPSAMISVTDIADAVIQTAMAKRRANVMTCWVGQERVEPARKRLRDAGIPSYETPGAAVRAFTHLVQYRKNQESLIETPAAAAAPPSAASTARRLVEAALAAGSTCLSEPAARAVLEAYGIACIESAFVKTPAEAARVSKQFKGPVALKILSSDIPHKAELGGVDLDLPGPFEVEKAANRMLERIAIACPQARIDGFSVQRMADRRYAHEVIIGMTTDPIFGPAIMFGEGGTAVELISDFALGLPPLNTNLARTLIERTRIARLLHGFGSHPPADIEALDRALVMVSQLVVDIPEIVELDINPLFADASGVMAVDCRIAVARVKGSGRDRLAIRPYPKEQEEVATLKDGTRVLLRPIRPEDEPNHHTLIARLSAEDFRYRFFGTTGAIPHSEMARLTQIDYDREMAFVAIPEGSDETWGVVRAITDPDDERAEFAVLVRSDLSGCGLGRTLMDKIIRYCKGRGNTSITGQVLNDNPRMLSFVESLGFVRGRRNDDGIIEVTLDLTAPTSVR